MNKIRSLDAHIEGIDGLRAFAVLAVMLYHLKSNMLTGGFVGVDVFFVISGYVVTNSLVTRHFGSFTEMVAFFYARRFLRIMPALIVMLLIVSLATTAFVPEAWLSEANRDTAFFAFFGLSNIHLSSSADDYFGPRTDFNPFAHTWSLGVEEQFYLLFPILIGAIVFFPSHKRGVTWGLFALVLLSLGASAVLSSRSPIFGFFQLSSRFWELGVGLLLALTSTSWRLALDRVNATSLEVLGTCLLLILVCSFVFCDETRFPFPSAMPPVIATAGLLAVVSSNYKTIVTSILAMRWLSFIGLLSYSLYLWHWPIYVLMRWTIGLETPLQQLSAVLVTLILAILSYIIVEKPIRYSRRIAAIPRYVVVMLFCLVTVFAAVLSGMTFKAQERISLSVTLNHDIWSNAPPTNLGCGLLVKYQEMGLEISSACRASNGRQILVAGDSHATAYSRMFAYLSNDQDVSIVIYSIPGCSFMSLREPIRFLNPKCAQFSATVQKELISKADSKTIVFLPSLRIQRLRDQWGGFNAKMAPVNDEAVREAQTLIEQLSSRGSIVILEAPMPVFWSPPFRCSDWFNRNNPICDRGFVTSREEFDARRADILDVERSFATKIKRVMIWDAERAFCDPSFCRAVENGKPLFYDGDHLSGYGNDVLYPVFRDELAQFVASISRTNQ